MSCLQIKASLSPVGRGSGLYSDIPAEGGWKGHSPCPCCEQKLCVVPFNSLTLPPARIYSEGWGRRGSKGSKNKGIKDSECRCHCLPCLQEPPWP